MDIPKHKLKSIANEEDTYQFGVKKLEDASAEGSIHHSRLPHSHDFYFIMYVSKGSGHHDIDFVSYPVVDGTVFFLSPGQVHTFDLKNFSGYSLFFQLDFYLLNSSLTKLYDLPFFHTSIGKPLLRLDASADQIHTTFKNMLKESKRNRIGKWTLLRAYLDILLIILSRQYQKETVQVKNQQINHIKKVRKLELLVDKHFIAQKGASFYADQLNVSVRHLNNIIKKATGKTISGMLHDRVSTEAKRLLMYSENTVAEIAYQLGFTDKAYFHRFFKRLNASTPEQFRERFLKVHH